jgi:hypothetical protein
MGQIWLRQLDTEPPAPPDTTDWTIYVDGSGDLYYKNTVGGARKITYSGGSGGSLPLDSVPVSKIYTSDGAGVCLSADADGVVTAGSLVLTEDIFPQGDQVGLVKRFICPVDSLTEKSLITDHMRGTVPPTGFTWQTTGLPAGGGIFTTGSVTAWAHRGDYMYMTGGATNQKRLLSKAINWSSSPHIANARLVGRPTCGIRYDDDTGNRFVELVIADQEVVLRYNFTGSGNDTVVNSVPVAANALIPLQLVYLAGSTMFQGSVIGEVENVMVGNTPAVSWTPTRFGFVIYASQSHTGDGYVDWYYLGSF